jgi:two-component system, sensor histidine kinase PdtaS
MAPAEDDRDVLRRVSASLPILADLARGDVFLFGPTDDPFAATVLAEAKPETVPSILSESWSGRRVTSEDEPAVLRSLTRGAMARRYQRIRVAGHPTVQDVYPVRNGARVVGALAVEVGLVESERQKRKSIVLRRALERLRQLVASGRLRGAEALGRLAEHDGPMVVSDTGQIIYISSLAEQLYRKIGYNRSLLHHNVAALRTDETAFLQALESGTCVEQVIQEGPYTWLRRAVPLAGEDPDHLWERVLARLETHDVVLLTVHDVTDETQKERELKIKSAMIQEIHHRVKNNLQTIAALLRLQARRTGSPEVGGMLQETINRILSIAIVHEFLARQDSTDVDMREIAQQIVGEVTRSVLDPEKHIRFSLAAASVCLPTQQATSCALVLNELLHNTVEHGFAHLNAGHVMVRLDVNGDRVVVEVTDDGEGLPPDFRLTSDQSLGLQIVQTLVREDLKGTFELVNTRERGARAVVAFPAALQPASSARANGAREPLPT